MRKKGKRKGSVQTTKRKKGPVKKSSLFMRLINNMSMGILFLFLIYWMNTEGSCYKWLFEGLVAENMRFIEKNAKLTLDQKSEVKLRFAYKYLNYIRTYTSEDAVILFPFKKEHYDNKNLKIDGYKNPHINIMRDEYISYFLYPRKVVLYKDRKTDPNYVKSTHLAIIDHMGSEFLPTAYQDRVAQHSIIPLKALKIK